MIALYVGILVLIMCECVLWSVASKGVDIAKVLVYGALAIFLMVL